MWWRTDKGIWFWCDAVVVKTSASKRFFQGKSAPIPGRSADQC